MYLLYLERRPAGTGSKPGARSEFDYLLIEALAFPNPCPWPPHLILGMKKDTACRMYLNWILWLQLLMLQI